MPKFFCDYCDVYLTHDSMSVRKAHNSGRNHLRNVVDYYQQIGHEKAQSVIDSITASYTDAGQAGANPLLPQNQPMPGGGPPGSGPPGAPGFPPMPPGFNFPGGMPPPFPGMPGAPPFPLGPGMPPPPGGGRGMPPFPQPGNLPFPPPGGMPPFPPPGAAGAPPFPFPGMPPPGQGFPTPPGMPPFNPPQGPPGR